MPRHLLYATSCACQWAPSMGALSCELGSCSAAGAAPNRKLSRKNRRKVILLLLYWKRVGKLPRRTLGLNFQDRQEEAVFFSQRARVNAAMERSCPRRRAMPYTGSATDVAQACCRCCYQCPHMHLSEIDVSW